MGKALKGHRHEVFLMTEKTKGSGMFFTRLSPAIGSCCPLVFREPPFVSYTKIKNVSRLTFHISRVEIPASRPLCLGRVRADPSCFLNYMHVTNPSVDTLLSAK